MGATGPDQPLLALPGAAHLVLSDAVSYIDKEESFFDAMLHGWRNQQLSRQLARATIAGRLALIRRCKEFTNDYPWQWTPEDLETFCSHLARPA